jgi:hypothetical protein
MLLVNVRYLIFCLLPLVAFSVTLFVERPETAPSVTEVTELIKARINRMTSVLIARQAETEAYRESQGMINVSAHHSGRTPAEIEEALTAKCEKQLADLTIERISVGEPSAMWCRTGLCMSYPSTRSAKWVWSEVGRSVPNRCIAHNGSTCKMARRQLKRGALRGFVCEDIYHFKA